MSKVERTSEGNFWYEYRPGRRRFIPAASEMGQHLQQGLDLNIISSRTHAEGTFEPIEYHRNEDGSIGIPPAPNLPLPRGATRATVSSLAELDRVTKEMNVQDSRRFSDDGSFNENIRGIFGDTRAELQHRLSQSRSNIERDTIRVMLDEGEREDAARRSFTGGSFFHQREYDR